MTIRLGVLSLNRFGFCESDIRYKNKSGIQLIILGLVTVYYLLSTLNILPSLYVGSMPNAHQQVVRDRQKDKNKTNPQDFEQAYRTFLEGK